MSEGFQASGALTTERKNSQLGQGYRVIRRSGDVVDFSADKISTAMKKAFVAVEGSSGKSAQSTHALVDHLTELVVNSLTRHRAQGAAIHIEEIQDHVELWFMREGHYKVARAYVLYREERSNKRAQEQAQLKKDTARIQVRLRDGSDASLDQERLEKIVEEACLGLEGCSSQDLIKATLKNLYKGIPEEEVSQALIMCARQLIEQEPNYTYVASRLLLHQLRREAITFLSGDPQELTGEEMAKSYKQYFLSYVERGIELGLLDKKLADFDLEKIVEGIKPERDFNFTYLGLQTLYDRYFLHSNEVRFELPQMLFMRVAMGLCLNEVEREKQVLKFYDVLSQFEFMSSTPTLFNAGTPRPQLSSCFLTTIPDDLRGIFNAITDNALLAKFSGGLGNDWTRVRGMGAYIEGTNGKSQGSIPFMKVANDTAVAVNQGGKRKGAVCGYLESWHIDVEEFLELRKNTGDDRRRTHDMNTANWIPDLFMKRVEEGGKWTLFSPDEVPELHEKSGRAFEQAYLLCEDKASRGELKVFKEIEALGLWRKMLSMLYETGHPWITFKDACNVRSPQSHKGVIHSSNLCTEITLNTSDDEIAVCNLGSINLPAHVDENGINEEKLQKTVKTAIRMLDNVIDINYYSVPQARRSNLRHRPIGLGVMGFQDALYKQNIAYASEQALEFADASMELISYNAIMASSELARERGSYSTFKGSLWSRGILPMDSLDILQNERGKEYLDVDRSSQLDWGVLREHVTTYGMRNSNCLAIAPTATISNICGVSQSIEPTYQNLYVKSNLSGEFTVVNPYLAAALKERDLWDDAMVHDLKYYDGSLQKIERVPEDLKQLYATAFELEPRWLVGAASRRQKWIDQAQSLNLYMAEPSGRKLDELYRLAWKQGLKTTYYLRALGATHAEKSTVTVGNLNAVNSHASAPRACSIDDPECEACQ